MLDCYFKSRRITFLILSSDALGNISLDASYKTSNSYSSLEGPPKPSRILTLAGGPTGSGSGSTGYIDIATINSSAIAPVNSATCRTQYHLLKLGL